MKTFSFGQRIYLSPFRWAGSKRKIIRTLASFWKPGYKRYVEPFCGSASLFFELTPSRAKLSDVNFELIHAFQVVRDSPQKVWDAANAFAPDAKTYYQVRSM